MKKRVYSKEFKQEAVRLSDQRDNIKILADKLGVSPQPIFKWRRDFQKEPSSKVSRSKEDQPIKIKQLERALKDKELELEILKKAVHIFSKSDGMSINLQTFISR
jgi:transposase